MQIFHRKATFTLIQNQAPFIYPELCKYHENRNFLPILYLILQEHRKVGSRPRWVPEAIFSMSVHFSRIFSRGLTVVQLHLTKPKLREKNLFY